MVVSESAGSLSSAFVHQALLPDLHLDSEERLRVILTSSPNEVIPVRRSPEGSCHGSWKPPSSDWSPRRLVVDFRIGFQIPGRVGIENTEAVISRTYEQARGPGRAEKERKGHAQEFLLRPQSALGVSICCGIKMTRHGWRNLISTIPFPGRFATLSTTVLAAERNRTGTQDPDLYRVNLS